VSQGPGLVELSIRGVGVIDSAAWSWGPGLTAITGETGAGKTMVLTGLSLVLGGPSDAGLVRAGHDTAVVEGRFASDDPEVSALLSESGGQVDEDGTILLSRSIAAAGRSRAHLGGRTVPAATLSHLGARLVTVHGQDDQHRLLRPAQQRAALDRFGGAETERQRDAYRAAYDELLDLRRQRDEVLARARERELEAELLAAEIDAIDRTAPQEGEEESLRQEAARLAHVDELSRSVADARGALVGEDGSAAAEAAAAHAALARAAEHDPGVAAMRDRCGQLDSELVELGADLGRYLDALEADPGRLDAVEERRAALGDLRRRLDRSGLWSDLTADPVAWRARASDRLSQISDDDTLVSDLQARITLLEGEASQRAAALSVARSEAAHRLGEVVTAELAALAMSGSQLIVDVRRRPAGGAEIDLEVDGVPQGADRHGIDDIEFLLATRDAPEGRGLARGASGGERSRIMLALEVALAGLDPVPTFVFDEVDAGVGGKAAVEVGHRLALLARTSQVIVVTHLAQVAAFADQHVVVRPGTVTAASISYVDGPERVTELARMLAGQEESATAAAHAEELLALAAGRLAPQVGAGRSRKSGSRR